MSAFPGKVRVLGVVTLRDMMDTNMLEAIRAALGFELLGKPDRQLMVYDFIQARDPSWVRRPFFVEFDEGDVWFDARRSARNVSISRSQASTASTPSCWS